MNLDVMQDGSEIVHYQNPNVPIYIVYGNLSYFPDMTALCHWHEDIELLLAIKGHLSYNVNGQLVHIEEGNAILVNSRQMHYGFSGDGTDSNYICVCFKPELLCAQESLYNRYVIPVLTNSSFPYFLLEKEKPEHAKILELIRLMPIIRNREMEATGKLYELWQEIYKLSESENPATTDENLESLKQMLAFVRTQYAEHITLKQIATAGGVGRSKCCQIFKKYMGRSPIDYLNSFRLEKAIELLRENDLSITEVAHACGFGSSSYFTEIFTREKGCTPSKYRKIKRV